MLLVFYSSEASYVEKRPIYYLVFETKFLLQTILQKNVQKLGIPSLSGHQKIFIIFFRVHHNILGHELMLTKKDFYGLNMRKRIRERLEWRV